MSGRRSLLIIAVCLSTILIFGFISYDRRPDILGLDMKSHRLSPSYKRVIINGRQALKWSVRGRGESGGLNYQGRWNDNLNFQTWWLDVVEQQVYRRDFTIKASELSNFGPGKEYHVRLNIQFGPGADLVVITPDQNLLAHIGQFGGANLANVPSNPVTLRALCGEHLADDDPVAEEFFAIQNLVRDGGPGDSMTIDLERAMKDRQRLLDSGEVSNSRCRT